MSNKTIYMALIQAGLTAEGACGLMGNMYAESTMKSNIAQRGMTPLSDEQYTLGADIGTINFTSDSVGYGLCQWTYGPRKAALLAYAKSQNKSVGDENMQVQFCLKELQEYGSVLKVLTTSHDLKECSDIVCTKFERPAVNNLEDRYNYSMKFYDEFGVMNPAFTEKPTPTPETAAPVNIKPGAPTIGKKSESVKPKSQPTNPQSFTGFLSEMVNAFKGTSTAGSTAGATMPILKEGDTGAGVAAIQVALKYHKIDLGETGTLGVWEAGTTKGVKDFQLQNGIRVSGQVDGVTWGKLMS